MESRLIGTKYGTKSSGPKRLPALNTSKDVNQILDKAEKEFERKEKDFIIKILSPTVPLRPIEEPRDTHKLIKEPYARSSHFKLGQDILEFKRSQLHQLKDESVKKAMSASHFPRTKTSHSVQRGCSSGFERGDFLKSGSSGDRFSNKAPEIIPPHSPNIISSHKNAKSEKDSRTQSLVSSQNGTNKKSFSTTGLDTDQANKESQKKDETENKTLNNPMNDTQVSNQSSFQPDAPSELQSNKNMDEKESRDFNEKETKTIYRRDVLKYNEPIEAPFKHLQTSHLNDNVNQNTYTRKKEKITTVNQCRKAENIFEQKHSNLPSLDNALEDKNDSEDVKPPDTSKTTENGLVLSPNQTTTTVQENAKQTKNQAASQMKQTDDNDLKEGVVRENLRQSSETNLGKDTLDKGGIVESKARWIKDSSGSQRGSKHRSRRDSQCGNSEEKSPFSSAKERPPEVAPSNTPISPLLHPNPDPSLEKRSPPSRAPDEVYLTWKTSNLASEDNNLGRGRGEKREILPSKESEEGEKCLVGESRGDLGRLWDAKRTDEGSGICSVAKEETDGRDERKYEGNGTSPTERGSTEGNKRESSEETVDHVGEDEKYEDASGEWNDQEKSKGRDEEIGSDHTGTLVDGKSFTNSGNYPNEEKFSFSKTIEEFNVQIRITKQMSEDLQNTPCTSEPKLETLQKNPTELETTRESSANLEISQHSPAKLEVHQSSPPLYKKKLDPSSQELENTELHSSERLEVDPEKITYLKTKKDNCEHENSSNLTSIDAICLNIPFSLGDEEACFESPTVKYFINNTEFLGVIKPAPNYALETGNWSGVEPSGEQEPPLIPLQNLDAERVLSAKLKSLIEREDIDPGIYERYQKFLKMETNRSHSAVGELERDIKTNNDSLYTHVDEINEAPHVRECHADRNEPISPEFMSCDHQVIYAEKGQKSGNQSKTQLRTKRTNGSASHTEISSCSQSGFKEASSAIKSIENSDLKPCLTSSPNSTPQVPTPKPNSRKKRSKSDTDSDLQKAESTQNSVKTKEQEKSISFKEDPIVYSIPFQSSKPLQSCQTFSARSESKWGVVSENYLNRRETKAARNVDSKSTRLKWRSASKPSDKRRSDMLARPGLTNANYQRIPTNKYLPPLAGPNPTNKDFSSRTAGRGTEGNMVFDFLNPFRKYRARGVTRKGRVPISVKPNPLKGQKGYEYEDLISKRKNYQDRKRNSVEKIYIQDPKDRNNILVAEEIGYVYGDPRQHIQQLKPAKETRGIQTVPLKDKSRSDKGRKKAGSFLVTKFKERKLPKPFARSYDLQAASKLETPREKGDYVIIPSKAASQIKTKSVSFREAERGVPSISSTVLQDPRDRLYGNKRDVAIDSQNFLLPNDPYSNYNILPRRFPGAAVPYVNGIPSAPPMRGSVLERRASLDGPLPPVRARLGDRMNGEFFQQIHHANSHPNLGTQGSSGALLLPQEGYPESPLRTYDSSGLLQPSGPVGSRTRTGRKGWARLKELTGLSKGDAVLDVLDGSTTDLSLGSSIARMPGTKVPIVLLQGFFKNARGQRIDRPPPTKNEARKLALPKTLLEPNSLLRGALPILPTYLASFCLTLNIFVPGFGTLLSGWLGACAGRSRLDNLEKDGQKLLSITITTVTGVVQMFTVSFFFVGWFWSVAWGILLVSVARKYKQFLLEYRSKNRNIGFDVLTVNAN